MQNGLFYALHHDHEMLLTVVDRLEWAPARRQRLLKQLTTDLIAHIRGEAGAFYPSLLTDARLCELIQRARRQDGELEVILSGMKHVLVSSMEWVPLLNGVKNKLQKHIHIEEDVLFPLAESFLTRIQLEAIEAEFINQKSYVIGNATDFGID